MDQISGKREKRKLQFEDKEENERRLRNLKISQKQQIYEKHNEKDRRIQEMRKVWLNSSMAEISTNGL